MFFELITHCQSILKIIKVRLKKEKNQAYELKCGSCEKVYIGQSGRTFDERMSEHFRSYRLNYRKSNYANHTADFDHIFVNDFNILHIKEKRTKMNALESLELNKRKFYNILLNYQTDINSSPLLNKSTFCRNFYVHSRIKNSEE